MNKTLLKYLAKFSLVIFSFLLLYYFFAGVKSTPWEGDSLAYHIPIAKLILSGRIVNPTTQTYSPPTDFYRLYQPGAIESILSLFIITRTPLNLFDVIGIIFFFFSMYALAKSYKLNADFALLFASSMSTLHTIMRWVLSQTIDVWLAAFFGLAIILLNKPSRNYRYFLLLGLVLGMLFGGKYTGPAYFLILILVFGKNFLKYLTFRNFIIFLLPFLIFGLSWYIRNLILAGDPYYPQSIPFFKGIPYGVLATPVGKMIIKLPKVWLDSFISEYSVWFLALIAAPFLAFRFKDKIAIDLSVIGLLSFVVYFFLPSGPYPNLITSGFRYTYPALIPLILTVFIFAQKFNKENLLAVIALVSMLIMPEFSYHPKILILLIPIALLIYKEDLLPTRSKV